MCVCVTEIYIKANVERLFTISISLENNMENKYKFFVKRRAYEIQCTFCCRYILIGEYHNHLKLDHALKIGFTCIWCLNFTWQRGRQNYEHRYKCLLERIDADKKLELQSIVDYKLLASDTHCNNDHINVWLNNTKAQLEHQMLGRTRTCTDDSFYEDLDTDDTSDEQIFDPAFNLFSKYIVEFPFYCYDHWTVSADSWGKFVQMWESSLKFKCTLLPYWCLCDGGDKIQRHMICRYSKQDRIVVQKIWRAGVTMKIRKTIKSSMHLINSICYISNISSQCGNVSTGCQKNHTKSFETHFKIARPTPPFAELFLSLVYEGGFHRYLICKYGNVNVHRLIDHVKCINGSWHVPLNFLCTERGIIVPLQRHLEFSRQKTNCKIYIEHEIFLKANDNILSLNNVEWNQHQIDKGNVLIDIAGNMLFAFGKKQQEILNLVEVCAVKNEAIIKQKSQHIQYLLGLIEIKNTQIQNLTKE